MRTTPGSSTSGSSSTTVATGATTHASPNPTGTAVSTTGASEGDDVRTGEASTLGSATVASGTTATSGGTANPGSTTSSDGTGGLDTGDTGSADGTATSDTGDTGETGSSDGTGTDTGGVEDPQAWLDDCAAQLSLPTGTPVLCEDFEDGGTRGWLYNEWTLENRTDGAFRGGRYLRTHGGGVLGTSAHWYIGEQFITYASMRVRPRPALGWPDADIGAAMRIGNPTNGNGLTIRTNSTGEINISPFDESGPMPQMIADQWNHLEVFISHRSPSPGFDFTVRLNGVEVPGTGSEDGGVDPEGFETFALVSGTHASNDIDDVVVVAIEGAAPRYKVDQRCDMWAQDCEPGSKCTMTGAQSLSYAQCVELQAPAGSHGDPCVPSSTPGEYEDDCDHGSVCIGPVDAKACRAYCTGSASSPVCAAPGTSCTVLNGGVYGMCF